MAKKLYQGDGWSFEPASGKTQDEQQSLPPEKQNISVRLEKRAKGKLVTVLTGFVLAGADLKALAKKLKNGCGTGGTVTESGIDLQGDQCSKAAAFLSDLGYLVKSK